jgi:hypothetical protein
MGLLEPLHDGMDLRDALAGAMDDHPELTGWYRVGIIETELLSRNLHDTRKARGELSGQNGHTQTGLDSQPEGLEVLEEKARWPSAEHPLGLALLRDRSEGAGEPEPRGLGIDVERGWRAVGVGNCP